jgi:hypothetical protein
LILFVSACIVFKLSVMQQIVDPVQRFKLFEIHQAIKIQGTRVKIADVGYQMLSGEGIWKMLIFTISKTFVSNHSQHVSCLSRYWLVVTER